MVEHSEDFTGCLAGNLRAAARAVTRTYDEALRPHGLRVTQVAVLAAVRRHGPSGPTALSRALGTERSALARELRVLERRRLVAFTPDPADGRARQVGLTPEGAALLAECAPAWRTAQREMTERLGARPFDDLVATATRLTDALAEPRP
ncbi:winged helix-turn-helix transcriptional regulator [Phycicoccus sp. CSK15P-2]|uniref:MarR family winged helix-turn-helix transcriptional regulator n=1 Tax=Phycicoccus sp. CSK15P-2 TaxID=2807627 RepID=UPI00194FD1DB|nr:MarR family winged helix-turn-helix transcriptional regulator [Phycicoccus sp. CSK15P-2]MBM6404787.1 winged helix-turn-helix transcriptional regulator [Phycicoccus sp. CSK15P-2]